jgi:beta-glucanase (GH16 family)
MQFQKKAGHWSAFWLWNVGTKDAPSLENSPLRFEVDIVERPFLDDRVEHAVHWGPYPKGAKSLGEVARVAGVGEGWHTFAVLWTPDEYVFFVDGRETWRSRNVVVCQLPLYILLTDEIEFKGWAGDVRKAALPDEFLTDYVRVYDLVDAKTGRAVWKPKPFGQVPAPK